MSETKPYDISKQAVWQAYEKVKANKGAGGVDEQSIKQFEQSLQGNLSKCVESNVVGQLLPAGGQAGGDP